MAVPSPGPIANSQESEPKPPLRHVFKCAERTADSQYSNWEKQNRRALKDMTENL
ncbi:hypothetical protein FRC09_004397, partial [Ceratobasidium sp. 395]